MTDFGDIHKQPTSEQLLRQLLTDTEYVAVLEYAQAKGLESDNAVFFMVAMLKTYAYAYDKMLDSISKSKASFDDIKTVTQNSVEDMCINLRNCALTVESAINESTRKISEHSTSLIMTAGKIELLNNLLTFNTIDASTVTLALKELSAEADNQSLVKIFEREINKALEKRVPVYDLKFTEIVANAAASRVKWCVIILQIQIAISALVVGFLAFY